MTTKPKRARATRKVADAARPEAVADGGDGPAGGEVRRVPRRTCADRIRACARECDSSTARATLHALWRAAKGSVGRERRAATLDAALAATLDAVDQAGPERWALAEATAWGLSRLARSRRAASGAAAGRHLERLVAEARRARDAFAERDTRPARFVVVLARLFGDVESCRELAPAASAAIAEEIGRLVTADGAVVLCGSAAVLDRVVRWSGVRAVARLLGRAAWDDDVDRRWLAAAAAALRLVGAGGRMLGSPEARTAAPLLAELRGSRPGRAGRTARLVRRGRRARPRGRLLSTDLHDAAAATAVVRTGWERDAVRVLVEYRDSVPRLEIACGDRLLADGAWDWAVAADGRALEAEGAWTVSGWESDRRSAFLEIAAPLAGGMRLERQVVVLRRPRIVLLADALVPTDGGTAAALEYRSTLPLAPGLEAEPAPETREVVVYDGTLRFMALPLALREWRSAGTGGLAATTEGLVLEQAGHRRLYAPLWLDCDPRRIGRPLTWRQLTIADTRRNLPPHQAAGFRVQAGDGHWLLYRALDAVRNRTLLGCNVSCGFLLGRVKRSGEVARTVEIE